MNKTYLDVSEKQRSYIEKETYIGSEKEEPIFSRYSILPEEYDVFSELELNKISNIDESQSNLLELFFSDLRDKLKYLVMIYGIMKVLPKLHVFVDSDSAVIVNWAYSNYRFFINIERKIANSFYGIVAQDDERNMFSNSGKFDESNYDDITDKILDYIFNQS